MLTVTNRLWKLKVYQQDLSFCQQRITQQPFRLYSDHLAKQLHTIWHYKMFMNHKIIYISKLKSELISSSTACCQDFLWYMYCYFSLYYCNRHQRGSLHECVKFVDTKFLLFNIFFVVFFFGSVNMDFL